MIVGITGFGNIIPEIDLVANPLHAALPEIGGKVHNVIKLGHLVAINPWKLNSIIEDNFDCGNNSEDRSRKMIIITHSWGTGPGHNLADLFAEKCGRDVTAFYVIDGVQPPTSIPFKRTPRADSCMNIFQNLGGVHGDSIPGCTNIDFTDMCNTLFAKKNGQPITGTECHVILEDVGTEKSVSDIKHKYLRD